MIFPDDYEQTGLTDVVMLDLTPMPARTPMMESREIHQIAAIDITGKYLNAGERLTARVVWIETSVASDPRRKAPKKYAVHDPTAISEQEYDRLLRLKNGTWGKEKISFTATRRESLPPQGPGIRKALPKAEEDQLPKDGSNCR